MRKVISIFLSIIMLFSIMFALSFMAKNCCHKCEKNSSEPCPICAQLEAAQEIINKIAAVFISFVISLFVFCAKINFYSFDSTICKHQTLITKKVRIDC